MKKEYLLMGLLLVLVLAVSACTPEQAPEQNDQEEVVQEQPTQEEPDTEETVVEEDSEEGPELMLNQLYNYDLVSSYEYRITATYAGQTSVTNLKYDIDSDTLDGKQAWRLSSLVDNEGATVESTTWLDKNSYACLKITSTINVAGQTIENEADCPEVGPNAAGSGNGGSSGEAMLTYEGQESVTVPAGTFTANKYSYSGVEYWIGTDVPLPIKTTFTGAGATTLMELVSYS